MRLSQYAVHAREPERRPHMAVAEMNAPRPRADAPLVLGGYAALAESAWMGAPQASDVLEPLRLPRSGVATPRPHRFGRLLTREFSIAEASIILMASFF